MMKTNHIHKHSDFYCELFRNLFEDYQDKNGNTFREWKKRISAFANQRFTDNTDDKNVFLGDSLEILAEIFFTIFDSDPRYGLRDYTPVPLLEDLGVDAYGINANGHKCAVQVKFKTNPKNSISYEEICKTFTQGTLEGNNLQLPATIYIFTSAYSMSYTLKNSFNNLIVFIGHNEICQQIDNNKNFWKNAYKIIYHTLKQ
jgi:hypothetical protein